MEIVQCFGHHAYFGATYVQILQLYSNPNLYTQAKTCTSQHWGFYQVVEMKRFENQIKTLIKNVSKDTVQGLTLGSTIIIFSFSMKLPGQSSVRLNEHSQSDA